MEDEVNTVIIYKDGRSVDVVTGTADAIAERVRALEADAVAVIRDAEEEAREEARDARLEALSLLSSLAPPVPTREAAPLPKRPARLPQSKNSPCACGSGRKFKKCCM